MTAPSIAPHLVPPEILAGLGNVELAARTAVEGALIGIHRSRQLGFSQEFAEYRAYEPGDDLRFIDWNVYARLDRLCVKRFFGDTNTSLMVLLDVSGSMGFASRAVTKLDYGRIVAAALAYLAARQHDAVGLLAFADRVAVFRPPSSRAQHVRGIFHVLEGLTAQAGTELELPLEFLRGRLPRRSLIALVSDFYVEPERLARALKPLAHRGHDLLLVHLLDPGERRPLFADGNVVRDLESGATLAIDLEDLGRGYPARLAAHVESVRRAAAELGADHVSMDTGEALNRALVAYLTFRGRRL